MWLTRKATLQEGEQGCAICQFYNRLSEDVHLRCAIIEKVVGAHGWMSFSTWIQAPEKPNVCSFYVNDPAKTTRYKEDTIYESFMKGQSTPPEDITSKTFKRLWLRKTLI